MNIRRNKCAMQVRLVLLKKTVMNVFNGLLKESLQRRNLVFVKNYYLDQYVKTALKFILTDKWFCPH